MSIYSPLPDTRFDGGDPRQVSSATAIVRRFDSQLLEVHQRKEKTEQIVEQPDRPLSPSQGARLKVLRDLAREVANSLGLAPELLARKKDVEACLRHFNATGLN